MKSRLSASISLLNLGEQGRRFCLTNAFSGSLNFVLFNGRRRAFSRCQYQGFQSLRTASYSSDDDFADLGPPSEGLATQLKLLTQKPELKVRNGRKTKGLSGSSSHGSPHNIYSILRANQPSQTSNSIVKDRDNLSGRYGDMRNPSNVDSSCSVTVEDVTNEVADVTNEVANCDSNFQRNGRKTKGLSRSSSHGSPHNNYSIFRANQPSQTSNSIVKDRDNLSGRYGDMKNPSNVDSSCSVTVEDVTNEVADLTNEVANCDSNFQRNGRKTKGLSRSSSHGSPQNNYSIFRANQPSQTSNSIVKDRDNLSGRYGDMKNPSNVDSSCSVMVEDVTNEVANCDSNFQIVTIRIQGIAKETTHHIIHSICKSIGALEGLVKVDDAVDVLFRVKNDADSQYIVKRLNDTVIDDSQWSAFDLPKISTSSSSVEDARSKIGLQINSRLIDIKHQIEYKKVCFEDLLTLHMSVMHLEDLPTITE